MYFSYIFIYLAYTCICLFALNRGQPQWFLFSNIGNNNNFKTFVCLSWSHLPNAWVDFFNFVTNRGEDVIMALISKCCFFWNVGHCGQPEAGRSLSIPMPMGDVHLALPLSHHAFPLSLLLKELILIRISLASCALYIRQPPPSEPQTLRPSDPQTLKNPIPTTPKSPNPKTLKPWTLQP